MKKLSIVVALALAAAGCSSGGSSSSGKFLVVTTVSPITDLAKNVAGRDAEVRGIIPEGTDSHTFEPTPSSARLLAKADLILINGLHLEDPTLRLAEANHKKGAAIFLLGDRTITEGEYIYDFSFPKAEGRPNPHLWMDVPLAQKYVELIRDRLAERDPSHAESYRANAEAYLKTLRSLDEAIAAAVKTIPPANRALLTYHDSFAYFARHYGMRVIGAIQPADFAEPSAREVARLIDQIRRERVPAIFGSEVFPSSVLARIAKDANAKFSSTLRDDDLPGEPGEPEHSYVGLMLYDVRTMVKDLGGDSSALAAVQFTNQYD